MTLRERTPCEIWFGESLEQGTTDIFQSSWSWGLIRNHMIPIKRDRDYGLMLISLKVKHSLCHMTSNPTTRYLPKGNENNCPNKDLHMNVQRTYASSQKLEVSQISINKRIDKQIVVHTMQCFSASKRVELWYIQHHRWISKSLWWVKVARHQRAHSGWSHFMWYSRRSQTNL